MSEENKVEESNEKNPSTDASKNNDIPYNRFQEVNSEKNDLKDQNSKLQAELDSINAERKAKREEELKKNEDYKTLLTDKEAEIEKYKSKSDNWDKYEETRRDSLISKLPENKQKFASNMNLVDLEEFVDLETANANAGAGKTNSSRQGVNKLNDVPDDWTTLSADEKRNNWSAIVDDAVRKSQDKGTMKQ